MMETLRLPRDPEAPASARPPVAGASSPPPTDRAARSGNGRPQSVPAVPKSSLWARGLLMAEAEIAYGEEPGNRQAA